MCKTHLKNDIFCSKNMTLPKHMMTNQIFEHPNLYFDVMFLYNTFLSPNMHIFQYILGINIHNGPKFEEPRTSAYP